MKPQYSDFRLLRSCDLTAKVRIKICNLEGKPKRENLTENVEKWIDDPYLRLSALYTNEWNHLYVICVLYADGKQLCLPEQTSHRSLNSLYRWDETLTFSVKYQDLPANTQVAITIWDVFAPRKAIAVGGTTFYLFGKSRILRKGRQKLLVWPECEADGSTFTKTPGKSPKTSERDRLEKLTKQYERGQLPHVDWLDNFTKTQVKKLCKSKENQTESMNLVVMCPEFEHPVVYYEQAIPGYTGNEIVARNKIVSVYDPELTKENPAELKYLKLARSNRLRSLLDRDLKPNFVELRQITKVLNYPTSKHLSLDEKEVLWKFRYYLSNNKKALTKFLKSVDWSDAAESRSAVELTKGWHPIELDYALELLSASYTDERIRQYAVSRIEQADDEELLCYVLQLVQAKKYEKNVESVLVSFLVTRAVKNFELGNYLYWYLAVETCLSQSKYTKFYKKILSSFSLEFQKNPEGRRMQDDMNRQGWLVTRVTALANDVKASPYKGERRIEKMRSMLSPKGEYGDLASFPPIPLPLNPKILVTGIISDSARIFTSAKAPLGLRFRTTTNTEYGVIFKSGDDLRQDQLIIQLISLMDRLLRKENLDLKLTPYKVLATAEMDGMVEWVNSAALASVIKQMDIRAWLRKHHPDDQGPFGIKPEVHDNFIKSCAGYCVITHILGIGDRHLDNLMLTPNGNLFHIDFGYILGSDPRPLPPPMKLCKEMVEGMGGAKSNYYLLFEQYCCEAYNILRKSSNLILNLFTLMVDANIPAISAEPEKSILKIQEKFRMDLTDEEASQTIVGLLNDSVSALFPVIYDVAHKWAQYWRSTR